MAYVKITNFATKDGLAPSDPLKIVRGEEIDDEFNAIAVASDLTLAKDGSVLPTADLPMNNKKLTGLAPGAARTDSASIANIQDRTGVYVATVGGTADVITLTPSPAITSYTAGKEFTFIASGTNTTNVTVNVSGLGAKAVTKNGATALVAGDIPSGSRVTLGYDGTQFQISTIGASTNQYLGTQAVNNLTTVTALGADYVAIADASDSFNAKKALVSDIASLAQASQLQDVDASVGSNALTATVNPCVLDFRSATLTDGTPVRRSLAVADSVVVPNTATLGTVNNVAARLAVLAIDNAGTIEAAIVNMAGGNNLDETAIINTATIGTGADSANVIYSTTGRSNVAFRVVGFIDITEAAAGVWATAPTLIQGTGGQALAALSSLGYGQTWQNLTGSRVAGTTYYNTTGKPIQVSIYTTSASSGTVIELIVGGVSVDTKVVSSAAASILSVSAIVPPGTSYSYTAGRTISQWNELR